MNIKTNLKHILLATILLLQCSVTVFANEHDNESLSTTTFNLSGQLLGPDNNAPEWSAIIVETYQLQSEMTETVEYLPKTGAFNVNLASGKAHRITFTSPHHEALVLWLGPEHKQNLTFDVSLDTRRFETNPVSVGLTLLHKDKPQRHRFTKTENDTFVHSLELEAGEIEYQLTGISLNSRAIIDPNADKYELNERGRWVAFKVHSGGEATFNFKPPAEQSIKAEQRLRFVGDWTTDLTTNFLIQADMLQINRDKYFFSKLKKDDSIVYEAGLERIEQLLKNYPDKQSQQLIHLMASGLYREPAKFAQEVIAQTSPTSWFWLFDRIDYLDTLTTAIKGYDKDAYLKNITEVYATNQDDILTHLNTWYSKDKAGQTVMYLAYAFKALGDTDNYQIYYDTFMSDFTEIDNFEFYSGLIGQKKVDVGTIFPEFKVASLTNEGATYTNATFKGKYVLYDFWGSWCPPCIKELPALEQAYADYSELGFEILGFNADETVDVFHEFRKGKWKMPWKHTFMGLDDDDARDYYGVIGFPTAYLVDPKGKIIATGEQVKGSNLGQLLERLLK